MGGSYYSHDTYAARSTARLASKTPVFKHDDDVKKGKVRASVHPSLSPHGAKLRESRDSDAHPVTVPIMVLMDVTGSMAGVPKIIEARLPKLMGSFLDDKASGKAYLGDGYPAILVGAFDDYDAMYSADGEGALQVGQFESGIEIDENLENLWLTGHGGGTYEESYELALYFAARHTAHDHYEKRGRRGYLFLIGDEHPYSKVSAAQVKSVIGDSLQSDIPLAAIIKEAQRLYHVFMVIPNLTQHYDDPKLEADWVSLLGQQNVIKLADPGKICETIVGAVALCEEHVGLDELVADGVLVDGAAGALVPLAKAREGAGAGLAKVSAAGLPAIVGTGTEIERL